MNASVRDIFVWLLSLDLPNIFVIWNWLINVPWWVALLTVLIGWQVARGALYITWQAYVWLCDKSDGLGQRVREWWRIARSASHWVMVSSRSFGRWLLQLLAIR